MNNLNSVAANAVLIGAVVFLIAILFGSIAVAISPQYVFSHFHLPKLFLWINKHWPGVKEGKEFMEELAKDLRVARTPSPAVSIWFLRISAIVMALGAAFSLWWIFIGAA